jgi:radical SAM protein with 4Fe4S-binding SPASM domain
MDWQTIERIVYNLKDLKYSGRISWFWINEPLMEKRIFEILKLTKRHCPRAFLSLTTNGDPLNETLYRDLRKSGLDALSVSIYDDKTFDKIKRMKKDDRLVTIDMRKPPPGRLENRASSIKQNTSVFENYQRRFLNESCERPFRMITVNPKGQVVLCCADMYSDVVMGDIHKQRLEEIWNNEMFHYYRKTLIERGRKNLKLCDGCSYCGKSSPTFSPFLSRPRYHYFGVAINAIHSMLGLDKG